MFLDASAILGMLLYAGNQTSLFASIEALKRHFAPGKILVAVVFSYSEGSSRSKSIAPLGIVNLFPLHSFSSISIL